MNASDGPITVQAELPAGQIGRWCYPLAEDGSINLDIAILRQEDGSVVSRELPQTPGPPNLIPMEHERAGDVDEFFVGSQTARYRVLADGRLSVHRPEDGARVALLEPMRSQSCVPQSREYELKLVQAAASPATSPIATMPPASEASDIVGGWCYREGHRFAHEVTITRRADGDFEVRNLQRGGLDDGVTRTALLRQRDQRYYFVTYRFRHDYYEVGSDGQLSLIDGEGRLVQTASASATSCAR
jgi:hypothetical protein